MAKTKETEVKEVVPVAEVATFSKEQILASNKFADRQDAINALWTDDSEKSIEQVETMLSDFMKNMGFRQFRMY